MVQLQPGGSRMPFWSILRGPEMLGALFLGTVPRNAWQRLRVGPNARRSAMAPRPEAVEDLSRAHLSSVAGMVPADAGADVTGGLGHSLGEAQGSALAPHLPMGWPSHQVRLQRHHPAEPAFQDRQHLREAGGLLRPRLSTYGRTQDPTHSHTYSPTFLYSICSFAP